MLLENLTSLDPATLSHTSLLSPPAGVESNFVNPQNRSRPFLIVTSILLVIMLLFFVNRIYVKTLVVRKFSWDDLTALLAVCGSVAYYAACVWGENGKMGAHGWDISFAEAMTRSFTIPMYLICVIVPPTLLFTKITFFIMYLHIFQPRRWMRISTYLGIFATVGFYTGILISLIYFTTPRPGETWFSHQMGALQHHAVELSVPQSVAGLVIDLYILILPLIAVWELQLPIRSKIGVMLIFMTGLLACLGSMLSIYYRNILAKSIDKPWHVMPVNALTLMEIFAGITCACMSHAAQTCRHHVVYFDNIRNLFSSQSRTLVSSSTKKIKATKASLSGCERTNTRVYNHEQHLNLDSHSNSGRLQVISSNSVRTNIVGGGTWQDDVENDGIHMMYEMETRYE